MPAKPKTKRAAPKWLLDLEEVEFAADRAMEKIVNRDGNRAYKEASSDLLSMHCATIAHMDGGPKRLLGMLRRLEAMYVKLERGKIYDDLRA